MSEYLSLWKSEMILAVQPFALELQLTNDANAASTNSLRMIPSSPVVCYGHIDEGMFRCRSQTTVTKTLTHTSSKKRNITKGTLQQRFQTSLKKNAPARLDSARWETEGMLSAAFMNDVKLTGSNMHQGQDEL